MERLHSLLRRQLKRHLGDAPRSAELERFVAAVDDAYREFDADRAMLERSLELSSQELLQANSEMRTLLRAIPDLFFRLDRDGTVLERRAGVAAERALEAHPGVGANVCDAAEPEIAGAFRLALARVRETRAIVTSEYPLALEGDARFFEVRFLPVLETQVLALVRDITARKRTDEELLRISKLESVAVLAGGIAHDFNNILACIIGNLSLAKDGAAATSVQLELLSDTELAAERARKLVKQLLALSKGGAPVLRVADVRDHLRDWTRFALSGSNVRCTFDVAPDLWPVEVDEGQIGQVIDNLVINAKQAMPGGGTVLVAAENVVVPESDIDCGVHLAPGRHVKVTVTDHGMGIRKEHLPRIFDPYFTTKQTGCGLGLATVYAIMRRHHGHVTVVSEVGGGTEFSLYLPAASASPAEIEEAHRPPRGWGRVLVVDDEELVRRSARKMLEHLGYSVELATTGEEAVVAYGSARRDGRPFDAVIMDLTLPAGMGGEAAVRELAGIDPGVRAIVSSGYAEQPVMSDHRRYGFRGILPKPYALGDLARALKGVLGGAPPPPAAASPAP